MFYHQSVCLCWIKSYGRRVLSVAGHNALLELASGQITLNRILNMVEATAPTCWFGPGHYTSARLLVGLRGHGAG